MDDWTRTVLGELNEMIKSQQREITKLRLMVLKISHRVTDLECGGVIHEFESTSTTDGTGTPEEQPQAD